VPTQRYTVSLSRNCRFASAIIYWLTSAVHCCSLTQPPLRSSHNLLAYHSGTLALSPNCRFASAIIYWHPSAIHCCSLTRLPLHFGHHSLAYLSATSLYFLTIPASTSLTHQASTWALHDGSHGRGPVNLTHQDKSTVNLTCQYASRVRDAPFQ
jgi:hypothetical protein